MDARGYQQYKQQSINSMTPGELLMLLYDELVKRSTLASIALFYAVWHWNSFFDVVLYITDRKLWPLQTLLREVVLTMSMAELNAQMADVAAPPSSSVIAATVMVSTVPILAVYPFLQKYFVKGVMVGAVKG